MRISIKLPPNIQVAQGMNCPLADNNYKRHYFKKNNWLKFKKNFFLMERKNSLKFFNHKCICGKRIQLTDL
jgi:hypothetical protein